MTTTSQESDFKDKVIDKQGGDKFERVEVLATNIVFSIMIALTVFGTGIMARKNQEFLSDLGELNSEYQLPQLSDLYITLLAMPFVIVNTNLTPFRLLNYSSSGLYDQLCI
jgi:hypothetical protein